MVIRTTTAALMLALLLPCAISAQVYEGFPESRVRLGKPASIPPDELYENNRVIVRNTEVAIVGTGMQISGEVVTDFDADRVPSDKPSLPKGQLMGLKVNVELYYWDTLFERDPKDGKVKLPQVDVRKPGMLVEGQSATVSVNEYLGSYGLVRFTLPQLAKPLAPGVYRLVATVRFKTQTSEIQQSIKWCSDLYGARPEVDETTLEVTFRDVKNDPALHEELYRFLLDTRTFLSDQTLIWVGEVYKDGVLEIVPPEKGTDRKPANIVLWSYHVNVIEQVMAFENQLDNVDKVIDEDLANKLKVEPRKDAKPEEIKKLEELKEQWKKEAEADKARIKRDNKDLIAKYGGRTTKDEVKRHTSAVTARLAVLEQVCKLHEYLTRRYWYLAEGYLLYSGWHMINNPGYLAWEAVNSSDNKKGGRTRKEALKAVQDAEGGLAGKWDKRREQWKFVPADYTQVAFDYLRIKEERDTHDPDKFTTETPAKKIELNLTAWSKYRLDFILAFHEKSTELFKQVKTTEVYAVQVWPQALSQLISARDDVIALSYAWEYQIRKDLQLEDVERIKENWKDEAAGIAALTLSEYFSRAFSAPGTIKSRFDGSINKIKSECRIGDFQSAYAKAVQAGIEPKFLPGGRPASAPTKEVK